MSIMYICISLYDIYFATRSTYSTIQPPNMFYLTVMDQPLATDEEVPSAFGIADSGSDELTPASTVDLDGRAGIEQQVQMSTTKFYSARTTRKPSRYAI